MKIYDYCVRIDYNEWDRNDDPVPMSRYAKGCVFAESESEAKKTLVERYRVSESCIGLRETKIIEM